MDKKKDSSIFQKNLSEVIKSYITSALAEVLTGVCVFYGLLLLVAQFYSHLVASVRFWQSS